MRLLIFVLIMLMFFNVKGQPRIHKPIIDSSAIANWSWMSDAVLNNDGRFFMYTLENSPAKSHTLVIQATDNSSKHEFVGAESAVFKKDGKSAIFQSNDSLYFLSLKNWKLNYYVDVQSYQCFEQSSTGDQVLAYRTKSDDRLTIKNLKIGNEQFFDNVLSYSVHPNGNVIVIKQRDPHDAKKQSLIWVNMINETVDTIGHFANGISLHSFQFDKKGEQLVLLTSDKNDPSNNAIWYYRPGSQKAELKLDKKNLPVQDNMRINLSTPYFSETGNYIFFRLQKDEPLLGKSNANAVQIDVWNYKDLQLQENQLVDPSFLDQTYLACTSIEKGGVVQLENDHEVMVALENGAGDCIVTGPPSDQTRLGDKMWLVSEPFPQTYFLKFLQTGETKKIITVTNGLISEFSISPDNKYLVYFDCDQLNFVSYDLLNYQSHTISKAIPAKLTSSKSEEYYAYNCLSAGIAKWINNRELLIYDNFDIWQLDVSGERTPKNITQGYGRLNQIRFKITEPFHVNQRNKSQDALLLSAFNILTKENGIVRLDLNKTFEPNSLNLDRCLYRVDGSQTDMGEAGIPPIKAKDVNTWIVTKQTASKAPNYYLTKDFKLFKQLTDIQPQKSYNWLTTQLLTWQLPDGKACQGILYKPEDFDSTKKYPVIVTYYEKVSFNLNVFERPDYSSGGPNVPWFVSRGYLVFTPDIHYTIDHAAESITNCVVSGVKELIKFPFVDNSKIAIQGQSFGGYETYVLVTSSNLFAAAVTTAGITDLVSQYGSFAYRSPFQTPYQHCEKGGQLRLNETMWDNQQPYIENSPIFKVDKVSTPLLIRHNKRDENVPWGQSVEFFIAMRRLNKPCWMLQYDQGGHGNSVKKDAIDITRRIEQFYDHYLKGAPPPKWMTQGIPAKLKGIDDGLELDTNGSCSANCKVCNKKKPAS